MSYSNLGDNVDIFVWSMIEVLCAVVLGSLPPLRPWVAKILPTITATWSKSTGNHGSTPGPDHYLSNKNRSKPSWSVGRAVPEPSTRSSDTKEDDLSLRPNTSSPIGKNEWSELDDLSSRLSEDRQPETRSVC
jgi:hypothetical protein